MLSFQLSLNTPSKERCEKCPLYPSGENKRSAMMQSTIAAAAGKKVCLQDKVMVKNEEIKPTALAIIIIIIIIIIIEL